MTQIKGLATKLVKNSLNELAKRVVIRDYREFCTAPCQRRALVSYLALPVLPPPRWRDRTRFSSRGAAQEIPRALNEMGYVVDIVNLDNLSWRPKKHYDLFIGHAGINYEHIARHLAESTIRIFYATGVYWKEFNAREAQRFYELALRRGYFLPPDRAIAHSEEYATQTADGIIVLSRGEGLQTYQAFPRVAGIRNAVFPVQWQGWRHKDFAAARRNFVFFSGNGNVHKGLDLLLESFVGTDLHLHVCQRIEPDFAKVYAYELKNCANIHVHNFVQMRSPAFEALASSCNWVISATCSEGTPGAILECMAHGLIPILPAEANIDLDEWGVQLPDCRVETIRTVITAASQMSPEECKTRAASAFNTARDEFSVEQFRVNFKEAVSEIVFSAQQGRIRDDGFLLEEKGQAAPRTP